MRAAANEAALQTQRQHAHASSVQRQQQQPAEIVKDGLVLTRNLPMQKTKRRAPEPETRLPMEKRTSNGTSATSPATASSFTGVFLPKPPKSMETPAERIGGAIAFGESRRCAGSTLKAADSGAAAAINRIKDRDMLETASKRERAREAWRKYKVRQQRQARDGGAFEQILKSRKKGWPLAASTIGFRNSSACEG